MKLPSFFKNHTPSVFLCLSVVFGLVGCGDKPLVNKDVDQPAESQQSFTPRVAETGVGKQGQSLEGESGVGKMIAQPAITLFRVKQKVVFEIQIPKTMQLFKALEGRNPKSHAEFMKEIIKKGQIKLPELPAGQIYNYHPDDGQLWVEPAPE